MDTFPMNRIQLSKCNPLLIFIPAIYVVTNSVHHDSALWGICFPVGASSFHQSIIHIIKKHLKGGWHPILQASL